MNCSSIRQALEQKIHQLELELKVNRDAIKEIETKLENKEKHKRDLLEAKAAQERVLKIQDKLVVTGSAKRRNHDPRKVGYRQARILYSDRSKAWKTVAIS